MKKLRIFTFILVFIAIFSWVGCNYDDLPTTSSPPVVGTLRAIISIGDDNPPAAIDSVLKDIPVLISGARSTGNPINYVWKIYRIRTGALVDSTSGPEKKIWQKIFSQVDTLSVILKVYGPGGPSDTSSAAMTLRVLASFGQGGANDIFVYSSTLLTNGMRQYVVACVKARVTWGNKDNPGYVGTHTSWTNQGMSTNDTVPTPPAWKMTYACFDNMSIRWNYFGSSTDNNWSDANGSVFKTSYENTYTTILSNGSMYPQGGAPGIILPGVYGDTVIRFDVTTDSLYMFTNSRWITGPSGIPWYEANLYSFTKKNQTVYNSTGYQKIVVPMALVRQYNNRVQLRYGGPNLANMSASPLFSNGLLDFQVIGPTAPFPHGKIVQSQ